MGVAGDQPPREEKPVLTDNIKSALQDMKSIATAVHVPLTDVIEMTKVLEYSRRTDIMIIDGDYRDEHMGSIVKVLSDIWNVGDALSEIAQSIPDKTSMTYIADALMTIANDMPNMSGIADALSEIAGNLPD